MKIKVRKKEEKRVNKKDKKVRFGHDKKMDKKIINKNIKKHEYQNQRNIKTK
jgi:hypothetical protein